jgi:hypothetical protein
MVNDEFEDKELGSNLKYYPYICLMELRTVTKYLSQESRYMNPGPREYEARVLSTRR